MMLSYNIDTIYSSTSSSSKTRHAINLNVAIDNMLREENHVNKIQTATLSWKNRNVLGNKNVV